MIVISMSLLRRHNRMLGRVFKKKHQLHASYKRQGKSQEFNSRKMVKFYSNVHESLDEKINHLRITIKF